MLIVGRDKSDIIRHLPDKFLFIDDGALIDQLTLPKRRKVVVLDVFKHSLNPLKGIDYKRAREFLSLLNAIFPEGESTLTRRASNFALLQALCDNPTRLDNLIIPDKSDNGSMDAHQKIQTLLLSPVLKPFLTRATNFSLDGIILARLDHTLAPFDRFVIANLLISNYAGPVVIPDYGRYACAFHGELIDEGRLRAGVNFLDETPLKDKLLLMEEKLARRCLSDDAEVLAQYAGHMRGTNAFTDFVSHAVS